MPYNISQHTSINKSIGLVNKSTDARSYYFDNDIFQYRPYNSIEEVILYLDTIGSRIGHFPIYISNEGIVSEYWFKDGTADQNLILKGDVTQQDIDAINNTLDLINSDISNIKEELLVKASINEVIDLVADEASIRESNYNTIQGQINSEAAARLSDDNLLQGQINTNSSAISTEVSNRQSADNVLQSNIDIIDLNVDNLETKVNTEITNRGEADTNLQTQITSLSNNKVDKITGKGLSTEDYSTADKSKLGSIQSGATANSTDAQLRDRSTHTGTQTSSTISDYNTSTGTSTQTQINNKQPLEDQRLSTTNGISNLNYTVRATDGTGTLSLALQTIQPSTPAAGSMKLYYSSDGLTWITPTGFTRGIIGTALTANRVYTLPDKSMTFGDDATVVHKTGALVESIDGNKTFTGATTFTNNFIISGVTPALTWQTSDGLNANISRNTTLNEIKFNNSVNQPGATGKSVRLNIDGVTGQYITFNRNNTYLGNSNTISNLPLTIEFWFKTFYKAAEQGLFFAGAAGAGEFGIRMNVNGQIIVKGNNQEATSDVTGLNDGNWHYLQIRFIAQNSVQIYVDGLLASNGAVQYSPIASAGNSLIGNRGIGISPFFGELDNFLYYQRALSPTELAVNYNSGQGTSNPVSTGLMINVPFDEGSGISAANIGTSGANNNFTLVNGVIWNQAGKVSNTGSTQQTSWLGSMDGLDGGDRGIAYLGDVQGQARLRAKFVTALINNRYPMVIGTDYNMRIGNYLNADRDINGSVNPYSRLLIGAGTTATTQIQLAPHTTHTPTINQTGGLRFNGNNLLFNINGVEYQLDRQTGTSQVLTADTIIQPNIRYYINPATNITLNLTLPTTFLQDDSFQIFGKTGTFKIVQNANQTIRSVQYSTTSGTGGSLTSTNQYCTLTMRGLTPNTELLITTIQGTFNPI